MTDNEIIKALEYWIKNFDGNATDLMTLCGAQLLINRLKAENERLVNIPPKDPMDFCGVVCNYAEELIEKAKSEAYKECIEKVKEEIVEALRSNYKAQNERMLKTNEIDDFVKFCDGKILALRGIDDFLDNLLKEMG